MTFDFNMDELWADLEAHEARSDGWLGAMAQARARDGLPYGKTVTEIAAGLGLPRRTANRLVHKAVAKGEMLAGWKWAKTGSGRRRLPAYQPKGAK